MGGVPADEVAEGGKVASRFLRHRSRVVRRNHLVSGQPGPPSVDLLAQVKVQAEGEVRPFSHVGGSPHRGRSAHHEARARDDTTLIRRDDAPVYAGAPAEVVGGDDQAPLVSVQGAIRDPKRRSYHPQVPDAPLKGPIISGVIQPP